MSYSSIWTRRLGGPLGRHAGSGKIQHPLPWLFAAAIFTWVILMARQVACTQTDVSVGVNTFRNMCYSDIPVLWQTKGLAQGKVPFFSTDFEYPVLTGYFVEVSRWFLQLTGGEGATTTGEGALAASNHLFVVTAVLAFLLFLVLVWTQWRMSGDRPWDALMVAASPSVMATGLINWDLLVVALTGVTLYFWSRSRVGWAGVFLGLAIAAKFYPLFLLGAFFLLCVRSGRLRAFWQLLATTAVTWLAVNLPVMWLAPSGWLYFWTFNNTRGADLGSVYYVLQLAGWPQPNAATWSKVLLVLGFAGIAYLAMRAPRRPRLAQLAFLIVAWFLMVNTVYSPQYVLWLLPLLVLARPVWSNWVVFTMAELTYFMAVWVHLDSNAGNPQAGVLYWVAVFLRVGVHAWLCLIIAFDMWHPDEDPVRMLGEDDPIGGVLVGTEDSEFGRRLVKPQPEAAATS